MTAACVDYGFTGNGTCFFSSADAKSPATSSDPYRHVIGYGGYRVKTTSSGHIDTVLVVSPQVVNATEVVNAASQSAEVSPSEQLLEVRDSTSMTMSQIADLLGITRQTVYNRLAGSEVGLSARMQLDSLYLNILKLSDTEKKCFKRVAFVKLSHGKTLAEILHQENDVEHEIDRAFAELKEKIRPLLNKAETKSISLEARSKILLSLDKKVPKVEI